jgi:hypothetical protein
VKQKHQSDQSRADIKIRSKGDVRLRVGTTSRAVMTRAGPVASKAMNLIMGFTKMETKNNRPVTTLVTRQSF